MDVRAFPRYTDSDSSTGYTFFKPSNFAPDWMRHIIGPQQLNLSFDNLLRKVFPGLPADSNYVKEHGIRDTIDNMNLGFTNAPIMDIGNFERGRPIISGSRTIGMEDPNHIDKNEMLAMMLKNSADKSEELKVQIKKLIVKEAAKRKKQDLDKSAAISLNTLKRVLRALKEKSPEGLTTTRFTNFGTAGDIIDPLLRAHYTPKNSQELMNNAFNNNEMAKTLFGDFKITSNNVHVPRVKSYSEEGRERLAGVPEKAKFMLDNPASTSLHEHGHAATGRRIAQQLAAKMNRAQGLTEAKGNIPIPDFTNPSEVSSYISSVDKINRSSKSVGLIRSTLLPEIIANKRVLNEISRHGTPQEAAEWTAFANRQMNENYRKPLLLQNINDAKLINNISKVNNDTNNFTALLHGGTKPSLRETIDEIKKLPMLRKGNPLTTLKMPENVQNMAKVSMLSEEFKVGFKKSIVKEAAKRKKHKNNHLAGILGAPLATAGLLGLPAALPAARMYLRPAINNLLKRPTAPGDIVADYLATSRGLGRTPFKGYATNNAMKHAKPSPSYPTMEAARNEAKEHYDKFTSSPASGLMKWLDEVRLQKIEKGRPMGGFEQTAAKFNPLLEGDVLKNIRQTKDKDMVNMMKLMAAQKGTAIEPYGMMGIGGLGLAGAGVGLTGLETYNDLKK